MEDIADLQATHPSCGLRTPIKEDAMKKYMSGIAWLYII